MLLIKNGNVWLGKGAYRPGWDVLCEQDRITAVGPDLAAEGADVIDASGFRKNFLQCRAALSTVVYPIGH